MLKVHSTLLGVGADESITESPNYEKEVLDMQNDAPPDQYSPLSGDGIHSGKTGILTSELS